REFDFFTVDATGANDEKLAALSKHNFSHMRGVSLLNCPAVTDAGIRHLTNFSTLQWVQLEGTSITDKGLEILADHMQLTGVNAANCPNITTNGLDKLARSAHLTEVL